MAGNLLAIHSESVAAQTSLTRLNGATFVDATQKLGDRDDQLVAVGMHSAVEAALRKLDLIDFIPDSQGTAQIRTFQGRRVIVDDGCPSRAGTTDGTVYTTFLFGSGAFGAGFADLNGAPVEGGHGTGLTVTPDGRLMVSASWDNPLRVWDLASGTCLHVLEGHRERVTGVCVTPDGHGVNWDGERGRGADDPPV